MYLRAALRNLLEARKEDDPLRFGGDHLAAEARQGLETVVLREAGWFPFEKLPRCRWAGGGETAPEIIRWWVTLAWERNNPGGTPLLKRYLGLLDPASREALGLFLLKVFLPGPLRNKTGEVRTAEADDARRQMASDQDRLTLRAKGILALAAGTPEADLLALVRAYQREHPSNWAQQVALAELLGAADTWSGAQFLAEQAHASHLSPVRRTAGLLVERMAKARGWTPDQLRDRTIPAGGLDGDGVLVLDFGPRQFKATLDAALKLVLADPSGLPLKSLPSPRKGDDPERVRAARALLRDCRKIAGAVFGLWKTRLHEAMCIEKGWPVQDWKRFLLAHPIVGRMARRLLWEDDLHRLFRPLADGRLVDAANQELEVEEGQVYLAHAYLVSAEAERAWLEHGREHGVDWLFAQLARPYPNLIRLKGMTGIEDRLGWMIDAKTFWGTLMAMGYRRGRSVEANLFRSMIKDFDAAGVQVEMEFTGAYVPVESHPAALRALRFNRLPKAVPLGLPEVPPVLLAEGYADYLAVAGKGGGYDPLWESRAEHWVP